MDYPLKKKVKKAHLDYFEIYTFLHNLEHNFTPDRASGKAMAHFITDTANNDTSLPYAPSREFLELGLEQLDMRDFDFLCWCADGGWGSVSKFTRKKDGKMVAMKFFGMDGCHLPDEKEIEKEFIMDAKLGTQR